MILISIFYLIFTLFRALIGPFLILGVVGTQNMLQGPFRARHGFEIKQGIERRASQETRVRSRFTGSVKGFQALEGFRVKAVLSQGVLEKSVKSEKRVGLSQEVPEEPSEFEKRSEESNGHIELPTPQQRTTNATTTRQRNNSNNNVGFNIHDQVNK